jgi:hypothetical protein
LVHDGGGCVGGVWFCVGIGPVAVGIVNTEVEIRCHCDKLLVDVGSRR